jgi:hypothetical protein
VGRDPLVPLYPVPQPQDRYPSQPSSTKPTGVACLFRLASRR